jgi:hypothetical protein
MDHIREGKHGAASAKQAIAIGLSKARRAGVALPPPQAGAASETVRKQARRDLAKGAHGDTGVSAKRSRAASNALEHEPHAAATKTALSRHAHAAARQRTAAERSASARKAAKTRARTSG